MFFKLVPLLLLLSCLSISCVTSIPLKPVQPQTGLSSNLPSSNTNPSQLNDSPVQSSTKPDPEPDWAQIFEPYTSRRASMPKQFDIILKDRIGSKMYIYYIAEVPKDQTEGFVFVPIVPSAREYPCSLDDLLPGYSADIRGSFDDDLVDEKKKKWRIMKEEIAEPISRIIKLAYAEDPLKRQTYYHRRVTPTPSVFNRIKGYMGIRK